MHTCIYKYNGLARGALSDTEYLVVITTDTVVVMVTYLL